MLRKDLAWPVCVVNNLGRTEEQAMKKINEPPKRSEFSKGCIKLCIAYFVFISLFYWIAHEQLEYSVETTLHLTPTAVVDNLYDGRTIDQAFEAQSEVLENVSLMLSTNGIQSNGAICVTVLEGENELTRSEVLTADILDAQFNQFIFESPIENAKGRKLILRVSTRDVASGSGIMIWYSTSIKAGKFEMDKVDLGTILVDGQSVTGQLSYEMSGRNWMIYKKLYWPTTLCLGALLILYCIRLTKHNRENTMCFSLFWIRTYQKYKFLIWQLINRDFKTKYKRSVLGVFWSFLNPLLTMLVQYIIFATLFKSDIEYFSVYLLSGIIIFNFFSESVGMGMMSILGNSSLITKVYMPKYIYPISRVLSSCVNFFISFLPLLLVMGITGLWPTKAFLLVPVGLIPVILFCIGMSFMLSTSMVFFRDTQFLWGVVSLLWMYLTPIFYPITIIPENILGVFVCNPLYQFITFLRTVLLQGISPNPEAYFACFTWGIGIFLLGAFLFKKNQDRFILYL